MKHKTRVITTHADVPAGYISMSDIRAKFGDKAADRASYMHRFGHVPAVKLMATHKHTRGPVWVEEAAFTSAEGYLKKYRAKDALTSLPPTEPVSEDLRDPRRLLSNLFSMARETSAVQVRIAAAQERTAAALERIANYCGGA